MWRTRGFDRAAGAVWVGAGAGAGAGVVERGVEAAGVPGIGVLVGSAIVGCDSR